MRIFSTFKGQKREQDTARPYHLEQIIRTTRMNGGEVTSVECSAIADRYWVEDIRATCADNNVPCTVVHEEFPA